MLPGPRVSVGQQLDCSLLTGSGGAGDVALEAVTHAEAERLHSYMPAGYCFGGGGAMRVTFATAPSYSRPPQFWQAGSCAVGSVNNTLCRQRLHS